MKYAKISSKNQITLGTAVMDALRVKPGDSVYIEIIKDEAMLKPVKGSMVDDLASHIKPSKRKFTDRQLKKAMEKDYPVYLMEKYNRQK
ncbi:AbrB/MazE/SpoVT family DNA-binding domain-containing protein [Candidatus Woesebacteria bacterium]|nr:AbrB/MazE/SpoVT family DNA-binding domain-containing protein [Candidatus Woesebacteria bacterium]